MKQVILILTGFGSRIRIKNRTLLNNKRVYEQGRIKKSVDTDKEKIQGRA